jgi:tetratricopeptide (TPR) repeat protein
MARLSSPPAVSSHLLSNHPNLHFLARARAATVGKLASSQQRWQEASDAFADAAARYAADGELQPGGTRAYEAAQLHFQLGFALGQQPRRAEEAAEAYLGSLALAPTVVQTRYNLGLLLKAMGRLEEAAGHFADAASQHAAAGRGVHPAALFQQGRCLEGAGKQEDAIAPLRRAAAGAAEGGGAAAVDTDYPVAVGLALAALGRHAEARGAYTAALRLGDPEGRSAPAGGASTVFRVSSSTHPPLMYYVCHR